MTPTCREAVSALNIVKNILLEISATMLADITEAVFPIGIFLKMRSTFRLLLKNLIGSQSVAKKCD